MSERWPDKLIVGLTGNIATGKSTVLRLAEERGALALDADSFVHDILANDPEAQRAILDAFGPTVAGPDGGIDRPAVASIVFNDSDALRQLEQILHPRVRRLLHKQIDRSPHDVVFIEAIKLLEGGLAAECDQVWVTRCPAETRVQRLMTHRGLDEETALMRVQAQSPQEFKDAAADVIIETGGSLEMTESYFEMAWARVQRQLSALASPESSQVQAAAEGADAQTLDDAVGEREGPATDRPWSPQPRDYDEFGPGISVRRAQPADVETLADLIAQATHGILSPEPVQLLSDFVERGYLLGQQGEAISAVGGWSAENLVATIDCLYVHPPEALQATGAAILKEIEITANELICEVIIALPGDLSPAGTRHLLHEMGFRRVDPETLPDAWRPAPEGTILTDFTVMLKVLRDTRQVRVRTLKEHDG